MGYPAKPAMKHLLPKRLRKRLRGFTLLELLTVITIIIILAGLILAGAGFAQQKAARDRASAEIAALSVALESYKADNGEYPRSALTDAMAITVTTGSGAKNVSLFLYKELSGDRVVDRKTDADAKRYFEFKPDMLIPATGTTVEYITDPFGNAYGYSTIYAATSGTSGNNPTYDLWSTAGVLVNGTAGEAKWIKNW